MVVFIFLMLDPRLVRIKLASSLHRGFIMEVVPSFKVFIPTSAFMCLRIILRSFNANPHTYSSLLTIIIQTKTMPFSMYL